MKSKLCCSKFVILMSKYHFQSDVLNRIINKADIFWVQLGSFFSRNMKMGLNDLLWKSSTPKCSWHRNCLPSPAFRPQFLVQQRLWLWQLQSNIRIGCNTVVLSPCLVFENNRKHDNIRTKNPTYSKFPSPHNDPHQSILNKGNLVHRLPSYGRWAFTPSCQPHHHVNHIIMSTTHHQIVGRCNSLRACENRRNKVSVSTVAGLDLKLWTKPRNTASRPRFTLEN